ncbi:hypothetical protein SteCoe_17907 [Stentor coeruleus]|uniref:SIAH-type domain-containing protein n=1 Tax=Stentor coeruleus TaxID=5963 RepID=A0A1R2BY85_9CILI|nr:hypothetical protein SteCoe_17907 [Stentor coeruleus]
MSSESEESVRTASQSTNISQYSPQIIPRPSENFYSNFFCVSCCEYLSPPVIRCPNDHNICFECINRTAMLSGGMRCSVCRHPLDRELRNRVIEGQLRELLMGCKWKSLGCMEEVKLSDLRNHTRNCSFKPLDIISCPYNHINEPSQTKCTWVGKNKELAAHMEAKHHIKIVAISQSLRISWNIPTDYRLKVRTIRISPSLAEKENTDFILVHIFDPKTKIGSFAIFSLNQEIILKYSLNIIDKNHPETSCKFKGRTLPFGKVDMRNTSVEDAKNIFYVTWDFLESMKFFNSEDEFHYFTFRVKFFI